MRHQRNQLITIIGTITSSSDLQFNRSHTDIYFHHRFTNENTTFFNNHLISYQAMLCTQDFTKIINLWHTISQSLAEESIFYHENARGRMAYLYQATQHHIPCDLLLNVIRTSISCPILKCNMNLKPNIRMSHGT